MGRNPADCRLERLIEERGQHLMRAAIALTGSHADGEDLLQAALERLVRNWRRVDTDPEGYLRRTLYNLAADGWRRRGRWSGRLAEFRSQSRTGPAAVSTTATTAGGDRAAALGAAQRGRDRGAARLLRGHDQVRLGARAAAAAGAGRAGAAERVQSRHKC